jgi:hypothetical protein
MYSSPSIIIMIKSRRMRSAGHAARMGQKRNAYRLLVGKPKGMRPLDGRRVDNMKMNVEEIECGDMDWIRIGTSGGLL